MDRSSKATDAYVEVRIAQRIHKTSGEKDAGARWDEDFHVNIVDDSLLQNEPLVFRVMDMDVYSADDLIGMVYIDLNTPWLG